MDKYTLIGFYMTTLGTVVGVAGLIYAIYISKTAKSINSTLMSVHMQKDFKKTKRSLLRELTIEYKLIKENNLIDLWKIREILIELGVYQQILSKDTLKIIKNMHKLIANLKKNKIIIKKIRSKKYEENLRLLLYKLISELKNDFTETENLLGVILK